MNEDVLIVSYLYEGYFHATRHVLSCGTLKRVQRQLLYGQSDPRFPGLCVLEEWRYAARPGAEARPPKSHSCVERYVEAHEALQTAMI